MQARALRVPVLCDDHTPPSCLVAYPLAKLGHRSVYMLVLPDPWLTQGGPVTFLARALCQLFVRSCDLAHHGPLQHLSFRCLPLLSSRAHKDEPQCMRLPLGTTECNHSYCTGNSLSALHSLQQLQAGASSPSLAQMSASTRESHGAAASISVSCPQVTLSATHSQVQTGSTRTVTSDLMSATLAEAATQLSFAEFLERRISASAPPPPQLPVPTPPFECRYADFFTHRSPSGTFLRNTRSGCSWLHLPRLMFSVCPACDRPVPSLLLDAAVQTPLHKRRYS